MSSSQDEFEDSRTSGVGRKRDLEDLTTRPDPHSLSSDEDSGQRSPKRARKASEAQDDSATDGAIDLDTSSLIEAGNSPPSHEPLQTSQPPAVAQPSQLTSWNKGVQSGLRTSFGSKAHIKSPQQTPAPTFRDDGVKAVRSISEAGGLIADGDDVNMELRPEETQGITESTFNQPLKQTEDETALTLHQPSEEAVDILPPILDNDSESGGDWASDRTGRPKQVANQRRQPKASIRDSLENFENLPRSAAGIGPGIGTGRPDNNDQEEDVVSSDAAIRTSTPEESQQKRPLPGSQSKDGSRPVYPRDVSRKSKRYREYKNSEGTFKLLEILKDGNPISVQEVTFQEFLSHFLSTNSDNCRKLKPKNFKAAFNSYLTLYYGHVPLLHEQPLATVPNSSGIANGLLKFPTQQAEGIPAEPTFQVAKDLKKVVTSDSDPDVDAEALQKPLSLLDTDRDASTDEEDIIMSEDAEGPKLAKEEPKVVIDAEMKEMELALQQKYFPVVDGIPMVPRCLACADTGHTTIDCPALSCTLCGISGNHSTASCPQNLRCGKCRQKGHLTNECPEKLRASKAEVGTCELCNSSDHLEVNCHRIWRSFAPKPEEIKTVRDIPVHCYVCGASGHYGPECGLHVGKILSGGVTWSQANLRIYLDAKSSNRAISAGIDFSIPERKVFSIKGKANDPINVDDSDDDVNFIRPKVNDHPPNRRNGPIRFEQNSRVQQTFQSGPQSRNPPKQAVPDFGANRRYQDNSARYGRERTFSPPPRYAFNPDDETYGPEIPYRQNENRPPAGNPRPQSQTATFTFTSQPVGAQSVGGGRRGGRPPRGRADRNTGALDREVAQLGDVAKKTRNKKPKKAKAARGGKATG